MAIHRKAISFCLVLCLAFAGLVGFSPVLHFMIEHGGHGRPHLHGHFWHSHSSAPRPAQRLFAHQHSFDLPLPRIDLPKLLRAIGSVFSQHAQGAEQPGDHNHHSLAQLLASGLIDQEFSFELQAPTAVPVRCVPIAPANAIFIAWHPEPPGRAPPPSQS